MKRRVIVTASLFAVMKSLVNHTDEFDLFMVDSDPFASGFYLFPQFPCQVVPNGDDDDYISVMLGCCEKNNIDVIFPTADEEVTALTRERDKFDRIGVKILASDYKYVKIADDKLLSCRCLANTDIPLPKVYDHILIVRPRIGRGGQGVSFIDGNVDFIQGAIPGGAGTIYVTCFLFDKDGGVRARFASRSLRTKKSFGGPATVGEPVVNEKLLDLGERVLSVIGKWFGPINVEFKYDERDGQFKFLEINPRFFGYGYLATACGVNFPYLALRLLFDKSIPDKIEYTTDKMLVRCEEDIIINA